MDATLRSVAIIRQPSTNQINALRYVSLLNNSPNNTGTDPRRARTENAILNAARELLAEGGVRGLTIEGVAARSGVAKTTIYRRFRDRDELALAVFVDSTEDVRAPADVGDTRKELLAFVTSGTKIILGGGGIQGLVSEIATKPELGRTYRERVVDLRLAEIKTVIDRGIERGDLRPDTDVRVVHELLIGPRYYRLLFSGAPLNRKHARQLVDAVMAAFAPSEAPERLDEIGA
jgi:AcrR family transcriptional regulator